MLTLGPIDLTWPDTFGLIGSLLLIFPVVRDYRLRWKEAKTARRGRAAGHEAAEWMFVTVAHSYRGKRHEFNFLDSACVVAGGVGLAFSYLL